MTVFSILALYELSHPEIITTRPGNLLHKTCRLMNSTTYIFRVNRPSLNTTLTEILTCCCLYGDWRPTKMSRLSTDHQTWYLQYLPGKSEHAVDTKTGFEDTPGCYLSITQQTGTYLGPFCFVLWIEKCLDFWHLWFADRSGSEEWKMKVILMKVCAVSVGFWRLWDRYIISLNEGISLFCFFTGQHWSFLWVVSRGTFECFSYVDMHLKSILQDHCLQCWTSLLLCLHSLCPLKLHHFIFPECPSTNPRKDSWHVWRLLYLLK